MRRSVRLIGIFCLAQVLAQLGAFVFPALLPIFFSEWSLSHSEAGWLSGIFFGAYSISVPFLVTLTDRIPARRIYIFAVLITTGAHLGMALFGQGFWTGMLFRAMAGVGWAGTYMVGLKALSDEIDGVTRARGVAMHAASIGISGALSFVIAGAMESWMTWQAAFAVSALGTLGALATAVFLFPRRDIEPKPVSSHLLDFRPVFRNLSAMAYSIGYFAHTWEMFVVRSWAVTFLVFAADINQVVPTILLPVVVAMIMELVGTTTSVLGNEMAVRIGRQRWILLVMASCIALALGVGFSAALGYGTAVVLLLVYNGMIYADSSSLTAGTVGSAAPDRRGATLAVHAMLGYGGGFAGPLIMGILLDALGSESVLNWGIGFAHIAVIMLIGPAVMLILKPRDLEGDRPSS